MAPPSRPPPLQPLCWSGTGAANALRSRQNHSASLRSKPVSFIISPLLGSGRKAGMDLQLEGKKAVVTGGSRGIGKAIARQLAREGCDVVIGARTVETLTEAARELASETKRKVVPIVVDTTSLESINAFTNQAAEALGGIEVL